jgi:lipopolysaccharide export system protein LptA
MVTRAGLLAALLWCGLAASPASAQQGFGLPTQQGGKPIEINADSGIEWHQKTKQYIARGNARAKQGDVSVSGDTLVAHYRKSESGKSDIWRIDANGNVRIESPTQIAYGDKGVYMVDDGVLVLTGKDIRLVTPTERITARDSLEYWEKKSMAVARGDAVISREDKRLRADVLAAHFLRDQAGKTQISRINAFENVMVSSAQEIVRADNGVYDVKSGVAKLSGSVSITRQGNQLNGDFAEVNLNTGVSRLYSGKSGRVQGLIKPQDVK